MAKLDHNYIESLVQMTRDNDSNAFAELYAATYQIQYEYAYHYLGDEFLAKCAVQETYVKALLGINSLADSRLLIPWLNQLNFRICFGISKTGSVEFSSHPDAGPENEIVEINGHQFYIRQILTLPFTEAQALILYVYNGLSYKETARLMDISKGSVQRAVSRGARHLLQIIGKGGES